MGTDKALVTWRGQRLVDHVLRRLGPQVGALAISANGDPARFAPLPVLPDARPLGPLSGVLAGLAWARGIGASALVTAPCDGPIFPDDLVRRLLAAATPDGALATTSDLHPTWGLWPVTREAELAAFLASGAKPRLRDFARGAGLARWPDGSFVNVNRPEDLAALEEP